MLGRETSSPVVTVGTRIDVQGANHWFGSRANPLRVLDGVSLTIQRGESVALLEPGGYGKSTLLCLIVGSESPTHSCILQDDEPINEPDPPHVVVFQDPTLYL